MVYVVNRSSRRWTSSTKVYKINSMITTGEEVSGGSSVSWRPAPRSQEAQRVVAESRGGASGDLAGVSAEARTKRGEATVSPCPPRTRRGSRGALHGADGGSGVRGAGR